MDQGTLNMPQPAPPRATRAVTTALACEQCGAGITPHRENAGKQRFCSDACRIAWHREHPKSRKHAKHRMHLHSVEAYQAEQGKLGRRALDVLAWIQHHGPATDRDVMRGLGFTDPNSVRPRVTELADRGLLVEAGCRRDPQTGKTVRIVDVPRGPAQMAMAI